MKRPDFIATFLTLAGPIGPFDTHMVSPWPLAERAQAAAKAGYAGIGFGYQDIACLLATDGAAQVNAILDDHGLALREIEVLLDWFADGERRIVSDRNRATMLHAAEAIGAQQIKVAGDAFAPFYPLDRTTEQFAGLCDEAAAVGSGVAIELFPRLSIASLETDRAIVDGAGRSNGGLLLDVWHMVRGGIAMEAIAGLPAGLVTHIELDDGPAEPHEEFIAETINDRVPPGVGSFPLPQFITAMDSAGYTGPIGVEILSHAFRAMTPEEAALTLLASCQELFD